MTKPLVLNYANPIVFLNDIAAFKKQNNTNWSLGVWARQLGLSGTASISRVLGQARIPGEDIEQALVKNLELNDDEAKYFNRLLERERFYHQSKFPKDIKLVLRNAQALYLVGQVDFNKAQKMLEPFDMEAVSVNNTVAAALNFNFYRNTTIGSYNESYMTFTAKHKKSGLLDTGLFFTNFKYSSKILTGVTNLMWGYDSNYFKLEWPFSDDLTLKSDENIILQTKMPVSGYERIDESYEMTGYAVKKDKSLFRTKFSIDTIGRQFDLDLKNDIIRPEVVPGLESLTQSLEFKAQKWVVHENLFCLVRDPESSKKFKTF